MISTIASSYAAAADSSSPVRYRAWHQAWQQLRDNALSGQRMDPAELAYYLQEVPAEDRRDCACDLISEHLRLSSQAGEPQLEDYVSALCRVYPELLDNHSLPADLIEDEFLVRSTPPKGDYPRLSHYVARFPDDRPDVYARLARRCLAEQRYIKLRVIGIGALGVVYEAYDSAQNRLVAVKQASPNDPEAVSRLEHEFAVADALDHSGVVKVFDRGRSITGPFYVMELLTGQSFSERILDYHSRYSFRSRTENRQKFHALLECIIQLSEAVAHMHERGILHRDIKPGNILSRDSGDTVIVDWGLARRIIEHGQDGAGVAAAGSIVVGTPQYMAPEQLDRLETPLSDIFSIGATLYEVLTGRPPHNWRGQTLPADWQGIVRDARIDPPRRHCPAAPRALNSICMKALAKEPQQRYANCAELAADLKQFLLEQRLTHGWSKHLLFWRRAAMSG